MNQKLSWAFAFLLISSSLFSKTAPVSSSQLQSAPVSSSQFPVMYVASTFLPEESRPDFSDFKTVLYFRMGDFEKILPPFLSDSFKETAEGNATSDHPVNWEEITFFFNNVATQVGSKQAKELYRGEISNYIKRTLKEEGWLWKSRYYFYEANAETVDQPAKLPLATLQRYTNWRTVHAWLYWQLKAYSKSLKQEKLYDANDELAQYFKKRHLWPIVDVVGSTVDPSDEMSEDRTDNIDAILETATEVGTYWFAPDGTISHVNQDAFYDFAMWREGSSEDANSEEEDEGHYGLLVRYSPSQEASQQLERTTSDNGYLTQQEKKVTVAQNQYIREELINIALTLGAGIALGVGEWKLGSYIAGKKLAPKISKRTIAAPKKEDPEKDAAQKLYSRYVASSVRPSTDAEWDEVKNYAFYRKVNGFTSHHFTSDAVNLRDSALLNEKENTAASKFLRKNEEIISFHKARELRRSVVNSSN